MSPEDLSNLIRKGLKDEIQELLDNRIEDNSNNKEFLTRKETADFFDVSLVCLHDWCKKGILTPYKVGNRTYFEYSELMRVLKSSNKKG